MTCNLMVSGNVVIVYYLDWNSYDASVWNYYLKDRNFAY